jgi:hypothetical protein
MKPINGIGDKSRLERLQARERNIRVAIAEERDKAARNQKRKITKLLSMIAPVVVGHGEISADFKLTVMQLLDVAYTEPRDRAFLKDNGWLL